MRSKLKRGLEAVLAALLVAVWVTGGFTAFADTPDSQVLGSACETREMNIFEYAPGSGSETVRDALLSVTGFMTVDPVGLIVETVSETEKVAVYPGGEPSPLTIGLDLSESGWSVTTIEGCAELVITADEMP